MKQENLFIVFSNYGVKSTSLQRKVNYYDVSSIIVQQIENRVTDCILDT